MIQLIVYEYLSGLVYTVSDWLGERWKYQVLFRHRGRSLCPIGDISYWYINPTMMFERKNAVAKPYQYCAVGECL